MYCRFFLHSLRSFKKYHVTCRDSRYVAFEFVLVSYLGHWQGGRCCASARAALTERSGSSTKGRTPNIRYFVAKLSIVAIYALFERLSQGFQRKPSCFRRAFNKSHPAFVDLSTKAILLS